MVQLAGVYVINIHVYLYIYILLRCTFVLSVRLLRCDRGGIYWSYGVFITEMDDDVMFVMVSKPMTLVYNDD